MSKEMLELADEMQRCRWRDTEPVISPDLYDRIVAALRASAVAEPVRCFGCGSSWTDENLKQAKAANPVLVSCCPERKPLTIDQWQELALVHPAPAAPVPASVREALELSRKRIAYLSQYCHSRHHAANEQHFYPAIDAALASLPAPEAAPTIDDAPSWGQENDYRRAKPAAAPTADERWCLANNISCTDPTMPEAAPTREEYAAVLAQELWCGATFADAAPSEREAFLRAVDAILALKPAPAK